MAKNGSNIKARPKVKEYVKNVRKSATFAAKQVLMANLPNVSSMASTNSGITNDVRDTITHYKSAFTNSRHLSESSDMMKMIGEAKENLINDFKSGKFYNPEREDDGLGGMEEMFGDLGFDLGGFDLDEPNETEDMGLPNQGGATDQSLSGLSGTLMSSDKNQAKRNKLLADTVSMANIEAAKYIGTVQTEIQNVNFTLNIKMHEEKKMLLEDIAMSNRSLYDFNVKVVQDHIGRANRYYDDSITELREIKELLKETTEMNRNIYRDDTRQDSISSTVGIDDVVGPQGEADIRNYAKAITQNLSNITSIGLDKGMVKAQMKDMAMNPWGFLTTMMAQNLMPKSTQKITKQLDDAVSGLFSSYLVSINKMKKSGNPLASMLGQVLGIDLSVTTDPDLAMYKQQGITRDVEVRKAKSITEVIPAYLSKITSLLGGGDMVYNFNTGKFVSTKKIKSEYTNRLSTLHGSSFSETEKMIKGKAGKKISEADMQSLLTFMVGSAGFDTKTVNTYDKAKQGGLNLKSGKEGFNTLRDIFKNLSPTEKLILNKELVSGISTTRSNVKSLSSELQESGMSILFSDFDKFNKPKGGNGSSNIVLAGGGAGRSNRLSQPIVGGQQGAIQQAIQQTPEIQQMKQQQAVDQSFYQQFLGTKDMGGRFKILSDKVSSYFKSPTKFIAGIAESVDKTIYRIMYGDDDADDPSARQSVFGKVMDNVSDFGNKAMKYFDDNILMPMHNRLFGEDGLLSGDNNKWLSTMKDALPKGVAGALLGAASSIVLPGGPMLGAFIGSGISFANQSEKVKNFLFGEMDEEGTRDASGLIPPKYQEMFKEYAPQGLRGAGAGIVGSIFLPGGPILGAMLGATANIVSQSDKFKTWMWGDTDEEGKRKGGVAGQVRDFMRDELFDPFKKWSKKSKDNISDWFKSAISKPLSEAKEPLKIAFEKMSTAMSDAWSKSMADMKGIINDVFQRNVGMPLRDFVKEKITDPMKNILSRIFSVIGKTVGNLVSAPIRGITAMARSVAGEPDEVTTALMGGAVVGAGVIGKDKINHKVKQQANEILSNDIATGNNGPTSIPGKTIPSGKSSSAKVQQEQKNDKIQEIMDNNVKTNVAGNKTAGVKTPVAMGNIDESKTGKSIRRVEKHTALISRDIAGQLNGVGWNLEYIRNILRENFGSPGVLPTGDAKSGNKKYKGIFGRMLDLVTSPFKFVGKAIGDSNIGKGLGKAASKLLKVFGLPFTIGKGLFKAGADIGSFGMNMLSSVGTIFAEGAKVIGTGLVQSIKSAGEIMKGAAKGIGETLKGVGVAAKDTIVGLSSIAKDAIPAAIGGLISLAGTTFNMAMGSLKGLGTIVSAPVKAILNRMNRGKLAKAEKMKITLDGGIIDKVRVVEHIGPVAEDDNIFDKSTKSLQRKIKQNKEKLVTKAKSMTSKLPGINAPGLDMPGEEVLEDTVGDTKQRRSLRKPNVNWKRFGSRFSQLKEDVGNDASSRIENLKDDLKDISNPMDFRAKQLKVSYQTAMATSEMVDNMTTTEGGKKKSLLSKIAEGLGTVGAIIPGVLTALGIGKNIMEGDIGGIAKNIARSKFGRGQFDPMIKGGIKSMGRGISGIAKKGAGLVKGVLKKTGISGVASKLTKFLSNTRIIKALGSSKIAQFMSKISKTVVQRLSKAGASAVAKVGAKLSPVGIGFVVYDIASGMLDTREIFRVPPGSTPSSSMRVSAGLAKGISGLVFGLIPYHELAMMIFGIVHSEGEDTELQTQQAQMQQMYQQYAQSASAGGEEPMSYEAYVDQQNVTTFDRFKGGAKKVGKAVWGGVKGTVKGAWTIGKAGFGATMDIVKPLLKGFADLGKALGGTMIKVGKATIKKITGIGHNVKVKFGELLDEHPMLKKVAESIGGLYDWAKEKMQPIFEKIQPAITGIQKTTTTIWNKFKSVFSVKGISKLIRGVGKTIGGKIGEFFLGAVKEVEDIGEQAETGKIKNVNKGGLYYQSGQYNRDQKKEQVKPKKKNITSDIATASTQGVMGSLLYGQGRGGDQVAGMDYYSQEDPRWKNASFGSYGAKRDTIGKGGCGPAVAAMAIQNLTGNNVTPVDTANYALAGGFKREGTSLDYFPSIGREYGVNFKPVIGGDADAMMGALSRNKPMVLLGKNKSAKGPFGRNSHYVLATGLDKNGNVQVLDPLGKDRSKKYKMEDVLGNTTSGFIADKGRNGYIDSQYAGQLPGGMGIAQTVAGISSLGTQYGSAISSSKGDISNILLHLGAAYTGEDLGMNIGGIGSGMTGTASGGPAFNGTNNVTGKLGIHQWFGERLDKLAQATGKKMEVTSGYRSIAHQRRLWNEGKKKYKGISDDQLRKKIAPPGRSRHNCGLAVDVKTPYYRNMSNAELSKFGLWKPMSYENWHIEPVETGYQRQKVSTAKLIEIYGLPGAAPGGFEGGTKEFIDRILPGAINAHKQYGILPSITIAQAAEESGWGKHSIGNNIFGIKAGASWTGPTRNANTSEYVNGKKISVNAAFRDYSSIDQSIMDHGKLLAGKRYTKVRNANNYNEALEGLQGVYATNPNYSKNLRSIIEKYNLSQYDSMQGQGRGGGAPKYNPVASLNSYGKRSDTLQLNSLKHQLKSMTEGRGQDDVIKIMFEKLLSYVDTLVSIEASSARSIEALVATLQNKSGGGTIIAPNNVTNNNQQKPTTSNNKAHIMDSILKM